MSIAYASNIGGTGSLIGSSPQLALKGLLNEWVILVNKNVVFFVLLDCQVPGKSYVKIQSFKV